ncbi:MAG: methyltransferase family protein [Minwuia sp.]|uniref:methyltransferase family protein n=1 Tax=Minwuia sp. TaxID=2493630 RepID=UPI003A863672
MAETAAFSISLISVVSILVLGAMSKCLKELQFFPPPSRGRWQHWLFKLLFRGFVYPLAVLSILVFEFTSGPMAIARYAVGGALFVIGFGLAFTITFSMGWRNAFGERQGLKTDGWFARSRNPVYVVTWIGLAGWGLLVMDTSVSILLSLWALMYLLAPAVEEPWLEQQYGDDYRNYKAAVPRFF